MARDGFGHSNNYITRQIIMRSFQRFKIYLKFKHECFSVRHMDHYIWNRHSVSHIWNCISNGTFYHLIYHGCLNDDFCDNSLQRTIGAFLSISFSIFHFSNFLNQFLTLLGIQTVLHHSGRPPAGSPYHRTLVGLPAQP